MVSTSSHNFMEPSMNNLNEHFPNLQPKSSKAEIEVVLEQVVLQALNADMETMIIGLLRAANNYISKPFDLHELQSRIRSILKNRRAQFVQQLEVPSSEISIDSAEGRFLKKAVDIVEAHLEDSNLGVEFLANKMAVSQTQLYRKLQALTGSGPNEFIRNIRLSRVVDLMRCKAGNVSEIAFQAGFNNLSYFAKVFKEKFGVTPAEYLKKAI